MIDIGDVAASDGIALLWQVSSPSPHAVRLRKTNSVWLEKSSAGWGRSQKMRAPGEQASSWSRQLGT